MLSADAGMDSWAPLITGSKAHNIPKETCLPKNDRSAASESLNRILETHQLGGHRRMCLPALQLTVPARTQARDAPYRSGRQRSSVELLHSED
jgi:hypothetical protein